MRNPKPITPERLERSALAYLQRFATSEENLRRVLQRKLRLVDAEHRPALALTIDRLVDKFRSQGFLNDTVYVEGRVASLRRQGRSAHAIRQKLQAKGVGRDLIDEKIVAEDTTDEQAAWAFARRRRLGPFRNPAKRQAYRDKDMAALGRAGFEYQIAREIIGKVPDDDIYVE